jgi:hypothetical protein
MNPTKHIDTNRDYVWRVEDNNMLELVKVALYLVCIAPAVSVLAPSNAEDSLHAEAIPGLVAWLLVLIMI